MVIARSYVPDAGDIVWISFNPQAGHEQAGHRPAVVLSPAAYNAKTSLMVCCPMTTQIKNYPFEVIISGASPSAVLADQVKSLDWRKRRATERDDIPDRTGGRARQNSDSDRLRTAVTRCTEEHPLPPERVDRDGEALSPSL